MKKNNTKTVTKGGTEMRDSFIFYRSFSEAIDDLPDSDQLMLYRAIKEYSINNNEIELTGMAKTCWILIKPVLTANNKRYEDGKKGGRPTKNNTEDSIIETTGYSNTETSGYFSVKPNKEDEDDKDKDVDKEDEDEDHSSSSYDYLLIKKQAKELGYYISGKQAQDFINNVNNKLLNGKHNLLDYAAERAEGNEGYFANFWKQEWLIEKFPAWREEKEAEEIRTRNKAEIEAAYNKPPAKCEKCNGEFKRQHDRMICIKCKIACDFDSITKKWIYEEDHETE